MTWVLNDGGRSQAGYKGDAGDCVTRAIAIALGMDYLEVYEGLKAQSEVYAREFNTKVAREIAKRGSSPRNGVFREVYELYLAKHGWIFTPTVSIGSGCKIHLRADELPKGTIIARVSKHVCAVIDGVVHDTHDPTRGGTRCVYGYYSKVNKN